MFDYSKIPLCLLLFLWILLECLCLASKKQDRLCICVLGVDFVLYIVLMYFGTVSTVLYHLLYIYYHFKNSVQLIGRLQKNASQLFHQQNIIFEWHSNKIAHFHEAICQLLPSNDKWLKSFLHGILNKLVGTILILKMIQMCEILPVGVNTVLVVHN